MHSYPQKPSPLHSPLSPEVAARPGSAYQFKKSSPASLVPVSFHESYMSANSLESPYESLPSFVPCWLRRAQSCLCPQGRGLLGLTVAIVSFNSGVSQHEPWVLYTALKNNRNNRSQKHCETHYLWKKKNTALGIETTALFHFVIVDKCTKLLIHAQRYFCLYVFMFITREVLPSLLSTLWATGKLGCTC